MTLRRTRSSVVAAIALALATATSCVREVGQPATATPTTPSPEPRELVVFAGPALFRAFGEIVRDFEFANEGVDVTLEVRPSGELADAIRDGATVDVFASDDAAAMNRVALDPGVEQRTDLVRNRIVVVVPPDNPAQIEAFEDVASPGIELVIPAPTVPAGTAAREAIVNAGLAQEVLPNVTHGGSTATVLDAVSEGAVDAGIVYASDVSVAADSELVSVPIPDEFVEDIVYPIAIVATSPHPDVAERFIAWLETAGGTAVLEDYGFETFD
ncbi:MAG TPA: molybdate ABC transporter substrate-binding protein [Actinomycetota bacterium]|nr:molybdate ABC transporter substrate-binding protein [Actinomycetota bacterium]